MYYLSRIIVTSLLLFSSALNAEVQLFLHPSIEVGSGQFTIADISRVSGDSKHLADIKQMYVHPHLIKDGFINRSEVISLLGDFKDEVIVYGNAVRVLPSKEKEALKDRSGRVTKGERVDIVIKRKGITIETTGEAMVDANPGEKVTVRISNLRRLKGVLTKNKCVEVGQ